LPEQLAPLEADQRYADGLRKLNLLDSMITLAASQDSKQSTANSALGFITSGENAALKDLWNQTDSVVQIRDVYSGVNALARYFDLLLTILRDMDISANALSLAQAHYQNSDAVALNASPFTKAREALTELQRMFGEELNTPIMAPLEDALRFAAGGIVSQAALALQHAWEIEVLSNPANIPSPEMREKIYGPEGIVAKFRRERLSPFLRRQGAELKPATWDKQVFPFTEDFLAFLSRAESVESSHAHGFQDNVIITVRSQPTLVDADALERPDATVLTLQCQEKPQRLLNRNYPRTERFTWKRRECGPVEISVQFPTFTLKRGYDDFLAFVEDFKYGERIFTEEDFPDSAEQMKAAKVRAVKLRMLPDNVSGLIWEENEGKLQLPDRIISVW
jgi:type VI secretion system protein ImpL